MCRKRKDMRNGFTEFHIVQTLPTQHLLDGNVKVFKETSEKDPKVYFFLPICS